MADQMPGAEESVLLHPKVICTGSEALCALSNYLITTSLGGLSGIKGTIPILMVAIGSRISDRCPLHLEDTWLESWVSIGMLSALLLLEILADCIPALASCSDSLMLLIKPLLSVALALSPSYGNLYGISSFVGWLAAFSSALLAILVAFMKAAWTLACDAGSAGLCSQVRSATESLVTGLLAFVVFLVGLVAAAVVLVVVILAVSQFLAP
ncbi:unnamed protein product [Durusdinium trenchii]|uniref:DUF4126 domain-containing protein n=1 Tax=Durusdinium trenchii TaxID=1381693 RepID=A0ABP0LE25_9DINO